MEEKQLQVREWAKLKLVGRPLMTGRALWVAIRPVPRLVHVYYDSNLRALLRFPEDPIFLLFGPCPEDSCNSEHKTGSRSEPVFASLLVITSDGCLWWISRIDSYDSTDRPAKKLKQNRSRETEASLHKGTEEEWDVFEDCDIYKDTDLYPDHDVHAGSEWGGSTKAHMLCKLLNSRASKCTSKRVRARCVQPDTLVGKFPGASLAAAGPENLIAVVSYSRGPILLTWPSLSSTDFSAAQGAFSSHDCHSEVKADPSCLLFASVKNSTHISQRGGVLSPKLFDALAQGFVGARTKHLLLQGNTAGEVHIFPVDYSNQISSSMVLLDLQEPISELIAFPLYEDSDALLVISSRGSLIAMSASKYTRTSTPFLSSVSEPSVWTLFRIDIKDAFDVHSWRVTGPVVSATMYDSEHLCFCSASSLCIVSLLENVDAKPPQKSSYAVTTIATSKKGIMKKSLACKTIPIFDVVALAGHGPFAPATNARFLVALTSRGRLVALRVPDHIVKAQNECFILKEHAKSWKPIVKRRDDNVMVLLDEIAGLESCTEALQAMKKSIDHALSELAFALRLAYDVLSPRDRNVVRAPHQSLAAPLMTGLHCSLEVNPVRPTIALKGLCFSSILNTRTHYGESLSNLKFSLNVTLSNHSSFPVSSYWTLLLDVHAPEESSSKNKMYFSSVINDGYGLAPGASSAMAFQISCAEKNSNPLEASVFLCHIHENHDDVLQASPTLHMRGSAVETNECKQNLVKDLLQPLEAISSRRATRNSVLHVNSRAACILLARYRVDVLSLLRPPQKLQHSSDFPSLHILRPQGMGANVQEDGTGGLRPFLGKFQLSFARTRDLSSWTVLNAMEKWKENHLDDLVKCCALSKDGEELSGTDAHGNTMLLTLGKKQLGSEGSLSREIQISAPSPLMGFLVREAVLWRLMQHFSCSQRTVAPDKSGFSQDTYQVVRTLTDTEKRLDLVMQDAKNIGSLWRTNHLEYSDMAAQSMGQAYTIFKQIVEMYRDYREDDASNPFWRFVCASS